MPSIILAASQRELGTTALVRTGSRRNTLRNFTYSQNIGADCFLEKQLCASPVSQTGLSTRCNVRAVAGIDIGRGTASILHLQRSQLGIRLLLKVSLRD